MTIPMRTALEMLSQRKDLTAAEAEAAVTALMTGECHEIEIAAFLMGLRVKGETAQEILGAARAMHAQATRIPTQRTGLLDTCGTGGDELHTFNISTAAAFVVAALGVPVAKHGNRSVSSSSGSADVLEALGVNIQLTPAQVGQCLDEIGIGFCFAPLLHGAMKYAAPVRKQLKLRTIFNLLGPLTNPAGAAHQLIGTGRIDNAEKLAAALAELGRERAFVVSGGDGLDEVSLWGETTVFEVRHNHVNRLTWTAADFGLPECTPDQIRVASPAESAAVIRAAFAGERGPARDIIIANAAAAWVVAQSEPGSREKPAGIRVAAEAAAAALDRGAARRLLQELSEKTQEFSPSTT